MNKKAFKINIGQLGGELIVGDISQEFYDFWKDKDIGSLKKAILSEGQSESNSPKPNNRFDDWEHWSNYGNIINEFGAYSDSKYTVTEIKLAEQVSIDNGILRDLTNDYRVNDEMYEEIQGTSKKFRYQIAWVTEAIMCESDLGNIVPAFAFHSSEKGDFGELFVDTNGDEFNPDLLEVGVIESDLTSIINSFWYNKKNIYESGDKETRGKSSHIKLGHFQEASLINIKESEEKLEDYMQQ